MNSIEFFKNINDISVYKQKLQKICGINLQQRLKQLKVGDKLICIKEKTIGYRLSEYYEIVYTYERSVSVQTDYHVSYRYKKKETKEIKIYK